MATNVAAVTVTGTPDFKIIDIIPEDVAKALQLYLERGSKLTGVSLDDIKTSLAKKIDNQSTVTLAQLLGAGMKIFDALVWLTAGRPTSHPLTVDSAMSEKNIISLHDVARAVFYCYFFILTQARYPVRSATAVEPQTPNFLKSILGMAEKQSHYVEMVCSFEPEKFDKSWVKYVSFRGLGQETVSRFGLGLAGYRLFGPFKLYKPEKEYDAELRDAVEFATTVATAPPTWDIHPATRDPTILTKRGNLNKNLSNLILAVYTDEQIDEMVRTKVLFKRPEPEPNSRNYLQWGKADDISGNKLIFRSTQ